MADVSPPRPRGSGGRALDAERDDARAPSNADGERERGQLFIVTALTLAVLFVALALLLNTAIFTENLATRSADPGVGDAVEYRAAADEGASDLLEYANLYNRSDVEGSYEAAVAEWSDASARHAVADGHAANISVEEMDIGGQIAQTDPGQEFTNVTSNANWTVVGGAVEIRSYNMTLQRDQLHTRTSRLGENENDPPETFNVRIEEGGTWRLYAYVHDPDDDGASGDPIVVRLWESGVGVESCDIEADEAAVDLVNGSVNDEGCFSPFEDTDDTVKYRNGDSAAGTYRMTFERSADAVDESDFGTSPFLTEYIWSADIELTYSTPDAHYETEIEVEPGDDDG